MTPARNLIAASLVATLMGSASLVFAQDEHKGHHPEGAPQAADPAPQPKGAMGGMGMGDMMGPDHMKKMQEMHEKMMGGGMAMGPKGDTGPSSQAFAAANAKMHQDMAITFTGDADVDFVKGMIPHHQGAIEMAKIVLKYGKDAETKKLAEAVIKAQEGEIAGMTEWLKTKGK